MINTTALQYFVATAKAQSFTGAASTLGVSQSTVSKMVKSLEDELGDELIVRHSKPLRLTACGQHLYERGRVLLQDLQQLEQELHAIQSLQQGRLSLGIPPMINVLFTQVLKDFRQRYPQIELNVVELPGPAIEQQVAAGLLDLGFSIAPIEQTMLLPSALLASFPIYAVGTAAWLQPLKSPLSLKALAKKPLLLLDNDFAITRLLRQHCLAQGLEPQQYAHSSHWDWLLSMAQAGLGIALLPEPFCQRLVPELQAKPIVQPEALSWDVALVYKDHYLSEAAQAWLDITHHYWPGAWRSALDAKNIDDL